MTCIGQHCVYAMMLSFHHKLNWDILCLLKKVGELSRSVMSIRKPTALRYG